MQSWLVLSLHICCGWRHQPKLYLAATTWYQKLSKFHSRTFWQGCKATRLSSRSVPNHTWRCRCLHRQVPSALSTIFWDANAFTVRSQPDCTVVAASSSDMNLLIGPKCKFALTRDDALAAWNTIQHCLSQHPKHRLQQSLWDYVTKQSCQQQLYTMRWKTPRALHCLFEVVSIV